MDDDKTMHGLAQAVAAAARSANFCVQGGLPNVSPGVVVEGIGPVQLPLTPRTAKRLIDACRVAPYGQGTKTLVDPKVRNSFELDPKQFTLSNPLWQETVAAATRQAAEQLGLPADRLEASLYKLLVYQKGGFFRHEASRRPHPRMTLRRRTMCWCRRFAPGPAPVVPRRWYLPWTTTTPSGDCLWIC